MKYIVREATNQSIIGWVYDFEKVPQQNTMFIFNKEKYKVVQSGFIVVLSSPNEVVVLQRVNDEEGFINDWHLLNPGKDIIIDYSIKRIYIKRKVSMKAVYDYFKHHFDQTKGLFPIVKEDDNVYRIRNGWKLGDVESQKNIVKGEYIYDCKVEYL